MSENDPVTPRPPSAIVATTRPVDPNGVGRTIGQMLQDAGELSRDQVQQILDHQTTHGTKFGESAIALGLISADSVLMGLGRQRHLTAPASFAESPTPAELVLLRQPFSEAAEIVRDVRSRLVSSVLSPETQPRKALAVCSVDIADGKSWFAANLAVSLCQLGSRVLLIDADLRSSRAHEVFGQVAARTGLSQILAGEARLSLDCPLQELPQLFLLPAGPVPDNPLELLQGPAFGLLVQQMCQQFDYVIVDTPAAVHGADARVVAGVAGAAIVVVRKHRARSKELRQFVSLLQASSSQLAGVVLNSA